jgi:hypothetical protein
MWAQSSRSSTAHIARCDGATDGVGRNQASLAWRRTGPREEPRVGAPQLLDGALHAQIDGDCANAQQIGVEG